VSEDIRVALDRFLGTVPEVKRVVLWGLCDAASAACFYAPCDARVAGVALLNPWVRTEASEAAAYLRHYYLQRLLSAAFWRKLLGGGVRVRASARGLSGHVARAGAGNAKASLPARMAECLAKFAGGVLVVLSEADLVAAEFRDTSKSMHWRRALDAGRTRSHDVAGATHTFSSEAWRNEVARATLEWVRTLPAGGAA
jgi:exosortase A-associated hydrolase 1